MSKRNVLMFVGTVSLLLGGCIYVVFRENTYIANFFESKPVEETRMFLSSIKSDFIMFYLPDFLWALSLCCFLMALFKPKLKGTFICAGATLIYGVLWELLQYIEVIDGTGDITDVMMYLAAAVMAAIINTKGKLK